MHFKAKLWWKTSIPVMMIIVVCLLSASETFAHGYTNWGVYAPNARAFGLTYAQWSARWWQYTTSTSSVNDCTVNQPGEFGPVWFLAGTTGGSSVRSCTIPAGKAILFPIMNAEQSVAEATSYYGGSSCPVVDAVYGASDRALQACARAQMDHANVLEASVDGVELQNLYAYRVHSPSFNLLDVAGNAENMPAGLNRAASDGYWILLHALTPGYHTIHFHGAAYFPNQHNILVTDTTYSINVVFAAPLIPTFY
jgi:hypothetical protein